MRGESGPQRGDRALKGMHWKLVRNPEDLDQESRAELDSFIRQATGVSTYGDRRWSRCGR